MVFEMEERDDFSPPPPNPEGGGGREGGGGGVRAVKVKSSLMHREKF